ncbi:MAG: STAS domain-containing protein [archaeon]|nr:STAS domain-containing protein [archaeon]
MSITKNANKLTIAVEGKLDRTSAPELEAKINEVMTEDINEVEFDLAKAVYISSAGLRVIVGVQKKMSKIEGTMVITNIPELILEIFTETGLSEILTLR